MSQTSAPKQSRNASANEKELWSVERLLRLPQPEHEWIIDGLLKRGSQMLLAAPPKSGKSLIASQIALAMSLPFDGKPKMLFDWSHVREKGHKGFKINPPASGPAYKVLFFSLEMRESETASRLQSQLQHFQIEVGRLKVTDVAPKAIGFPLKHFFGFLRKANGEDRPELHQDLRIVNYAQNFGEAPTFAKAEDAEEIRRIITAEAPDVVIFDTLIQLHAVNENDNVLMKEVMRALRRAAVIDANDNEGRHMPTPIAHIVLHHTRKEGGSYRAPLSPEIMRGAGAVHGVADLVMLARKTDRDDELEVHVSSRSSAVPNFTLRRNGSLCYTWHEDEPEAEWDIDDLKRKVLLDLVVEQLGDAPDSSDHLNLELLVAGLKKAATRYGKRRLAIKNEDSIGQLLVELETKGKVKIEKSKLGQSQGRKRVKLAEDRITLITGEWSK